MARRIDSPMAAHSDTLPQNETLTMGPNWADPAASWVAAIERYVAFVKIPAWRARAPGRDGVEPRECLPEAEAARLRASMLRVANVLASKRGLEPSRCRPARSDLDQLLKCAGHGIDKEQRCSIRLHWHFQRALLLSEAGYTCAYCRRSAWSVLAEGAAGQPRRTLRFEIDHQTTRRRLKDRNRFDAQNLVIACR